MNNDNKWLDDGFGNIWKMCPVEDCGLQIVRPGSVQCVSPVCWSETFGLNDYDYDKHDELLCDLIVDFSREKSSHHIYEMPLREAVTEYRSLREKVKRLEAIVDVESDVLDNLINAAYDKGKNPIDKIDHIHADIKSLIRDALEQ